MSYLIEISDGINVNVCVTSQYHNSGKMAFIPLSTFDLAFRAVKNALHNRIEGARVG